MSDGRIQKGERRSPATEFKAGEHWRPPQLFREREWLEREYGAGRSLGEIAVQFKVTEPAIRFWFRLHRIPRRSISEARAIKHWGLSGSANPQFGKRGPECPAFIDGSTPERQRQYARSEWRQTIKAIYARDGYQCQRCGSGQDREHPLHAHHIRPWAGNPEFRAEPTNLITLCRPCHKWVHSNANTAREFLA
jgi:thymidylate synthase (FAD)